MDINNENSNFKKNIIFPNERISIKKEFEIIRGIVEFSDKGKHSINYKDITIGMHPPEISRELTFLESIGLAKLEKRGQYFPTKMCIDFVNKLKWDKNDAKIYLNSLISNSWFGILTRKLLNVKLSVDREILFREIGKIANADPNKDKRKINRLVDWMIWTEYIKEEGHLISLKLEERTISKEKALIKESESKEIAKVVKISQLQNYQEMIQFVIKITPETTKKDLKRMIQILKEVTNEEFQDNNE